MPIEQLPILPRSQLQVTTIPLSVSINLMTQMPHTSVRRQWLLWLMFHPPSHSPSLPSFCLPFFSLGLLLAFDQ